jgi:3-hydroxymyristoyl/3-hydroxydecanoyl-(acyl carrier protein) dehydratase
MKNLLLFNESQFNGTEYIAQKEISAEAIYFEGHYPGNPVFPGVFQIELAASVASKLLLSMGQKKLFLVKIDKFRFLDTVIPGDVVTVRAKLKDEVERGWNVIVDLHVGEQHVSSGVLTMGESMFDAPHRAVTAATEINEKSQHMDVGDIIKILPHRYPFLQIDRVNELISGQKITSVKNISASDYMMWGREAGSPLPKSIIIEALAQNAAILGLEVIGNSDRLPLFGLMTNAMFASEAYPGDQLIMETIAEKALSDGGIYTGRMWVDNRLVCEIEKLIFVVR